jgi:sigma-B regulation protein RsbU (phosphoserine phosphatase)
MSNLMASLRAFTAAGRAPRDVVTSTNRALCRNSDLRRFVTLFYAVYNAGTRLLTYTNAGHNPPIVARRDGSIERLTTGGMVTGIFEDTSYQESTITLQPGDRLVLFTDGITEARTSSGAEFEDDGLLGVVARHRSGNVQSLIGAIFDEVVSFTGGRLQDDATVLAIAIEAPSRGRTDASH